MRDKLNITIYKNETFTYVLQLLDSTGTPIDLSGANLVSQCRDKTTNNVIFNFVCNLEAPYSQGKFTINLSAANSANLTPNKNLYYDVKMTFVTGEIIRWVQGDLQILDTVTT